MQRLTRQWLSYYKTVRRRTARDRSHCRFLDVMDILPPDDLEPTTLEMIDGDDIWIEGSEPYELEHPKHRRPNQDLDWWRDCIPRSDDALQQLLVDCEVIVARDEFRTTLQSQQPIAVADGSFHPIYKVGTAGVTTETSDGRNIARGFCRTTGEDNDQNPYRSELTGVLLGLKLLSCILTGSEVRLDHLTSSLICQYICLFFNHIQMQLLLLLKLLKLQMTCSKV